MRSGSRELSRTEVGLLTTLTDGSRSVSALAVLVSAGQVLERLIDQVRTDGMPA